MRGWFAVGLVVCSLSCGDSRTLVQIPVDDAASVIAVVRSSDRNEVVALDLGDGVGVLKLDGVRQVDAVFPLPTLEELGIEEGPLTPIDDGVPLPVLPAFTMTEPTAKDADWQAIASVMELEQRLLPHPDPCRTFSLGWTRDLGDTEGDIAIFHRLGPQSLLIGAYQRLFHLEGDVVNEIAADPPDRWLSAFAEDEQGVLWFGGTRGDIWQGELRLDPGSAGLTLTTATATPDQDTILAMAHEDGPGVSLVVVDRWGKVARWDGQRWTTLWDLAVLLDASTSMVRDAAGDIWLATDNSQEVLRIRDGTAEQMSPATLVNGVPGLVWLPDFGVTLFSSAGDVFHRVGDAWEQINGNPSTVTNIHTAIRFRSGFIFSGVGGLVGQYRQPHSFCPVQREGGGLVKHIVAYGDDHLLVIDGPNGLPPTVRLLRSEP